MWLPKRPEKASTSSAVTSCSTMTSRGTPIGWSSEWEESIGIYTPERKEQFRITINDFYSYLSAIGFELPKDVPPIGVGISPSFGGATPGTIYELQMNVPQDDPDNVDALLNVYSSYLFLSIFPPHSFRHVFQMETVHTFGDYYRWSFLNHNTINRMAMPPGQSPRTRRCQSSTGPGLT